MEVKKVDISDELKKSYLDYAMDVIVDRALPDARDGLKPVHRRVLFGMHFMGLHYVKNGRRTPTVKSARVVGEVMGKYHPHGDSAIYDTMVRMAQNFSLRYPLVKGQGNFGSIDGDSAAAMRYTEVKLEQISDEILADLDKDTVDLKKNYDSSLDIPDYVLPTRIPNLLINGCSGIAVGLATNIPTHNLNECIDACLALVKNPNISPEDLMSFIPGPDFPTGGIIYGTSGIKSAYLTGKGRVVLRCRYHVETDAKTCRETIVVTEIPYGVNKSEMVKSIAELMAEKKIEGIVSIKDVSNDNIRIEIEIKKEAFPEIVMNNLYKLSSLQTYFAVNMVAIVKGRPKSLTLKDALECFIDHRREVVTRRTAYLLSKSRERAHILEALLVALDNMDEIVRIIRSSENRASAKEALLSRSWTANACADLLNRFGVDCRPLSLDAKFGYRDGAYYLTDDQVEKILDMRLSQLVKLAKEEIVDEYSQLYDAIQGYLQILNSTERLHEVICSELEEVKAKYGDARITEIKETEAEINYEDLITPREVVLTLSHRGYIKYQDLDSYRTMHRGTRGRIASKLKDEDYSEIMTIAHTHDYVLLFTNKGRVYKSKVYQFPESQGSGVGRPIVNILELAEDEKIMVIQPIKNFDDEHYIFFATKKGICKKTRLSEFENVNKSGKLAITLRDDDALVSTAITSGKDDIILFTAKGLCLRVNELLSIGEMKRREQLSANTDETIENGTLLDNEEVEVDDSEDSEISDENFRPMGRMAAGNRGIKLTNDDELVSLVVPKQNDGDVLVVFNNGLGFRTAVSSFPIRLRRGGKGVNVGATGSATICGALQVKDQDEIALITSNGVFNRVSVNEIRLCSGRRSKGVIIYRLEDNVTISAIERIIVTDDENAERLKAEDNTALTENSSAENNVSSESSVAGIQPDTSEEK